MAKNFKGKPSKYELKELDTIKKIRTAPDGSGWSGGRGDYFFKHLPNTEPNKPISQVYFNHSFMTGLFRTKRPDMFTGDLKKPDGKVYLVFKIENKDCIRIFEKILRGSGASV